MILEDLATLPASGALLGLDPGSKTIGLAVSDATRLIASPLETVRRSKFAADAQAVFARFDERACAAMVMGLPLNMDGSEGPRAQSARAFARNLIGVRDTPIVMWDERLSTAGVEHALLEADMSRAKRKTVVDAMAASYLLQGVLDRLRETG